jgi:hypothetical protein
MPNLFVKPAPLSAAEQSALGADKRIVPDPQQNFRPLAAAGEWKPDTSYWRRRIRHGDAVVATPPAEKQPAAAAAPGASSK